MHYALVATPRHLLLVDLLGRTVVVLESHRPEYYGVSWLPDGNELVLSHSGIDNISLVDFTSYAKSELGWISIGQQSTAPFLSQPHQLLCLPDGRIACTNTGRNAVTIVDPSRPGLFQEIRLSSSRWDRLSLTETIGDHLNSVFARAGKLYIVAHGFNKGSQIATVSLESLEILSVEPVRGATGLHNIWITEDGRQVACHSERGAIIELRSGKTLWQAGSPIYTRGLAAGADYVLVGDSPKVTRDSRIHATSGLWVIDRRTWRATDYLSLGPYGVVHEVRIVDEPDDAHHGHVFTGIEKLLAIDERRTQEARKLDLAGRAVAIGTHWGAYEFIFGTPEVTQESGLLSRPGDLCLAVHRAASTKSFEFAYELPDVEAEGGSHCSVVVAYRGAGGDTSMMAFLLQNAGPDASLGLWCHNGSQWSAIKPIAPGLPLFGRVHVAASSAQIRIAINGRNVVTMTNSDLGVERCDAGLGIRWVGATVSP
jgi:hypothetical protein